MNDILLDLDNDLKISGGKLVRGRSDEQHQKLLLICAKGSFKENPANCVGLMNYLENESDVDMIQEVRTQFTIDGMEVHNIGMTNGKLAIDSKYNDVTNSTI